MRRRRKTERQRRGGEECADARQPWEGFVETVCLRAPARPGAGGLAASVLFVPPPAPEPAVSPVAIDPRPQSGDAPRRLRAPPAAFGPDPSDIRARLRTRTSAPKAPAGSLSGHAFLQLPDFTGGPARRFSPGKYSIARPVPDQDRAGSAGPAVRCRSQAAGSGFCRRSSVRLRCCGVFSRPRKRAYRGAPGPDIRAHPQHACAREPVDASAGRESTGYQRTCPLSMMLCSGSASLAGFRSARPRG